MDSFPLLPGSRGIGVAGILQQSNEIKNEIEGISHRVNKCRLNVSLSNMERKLHSHSKNVLIANDYRLTGVHDNHYVSFHSH